MSSHDHNEGGKLPSKPISLSLSSSNGPKKTGFNLKSSNRGRSTISPANGRALPRRPHQLGYADESDEDEAPPVHEEISGFDTHTGAAITADGQAVADANKPLIIPVTSKNNWRDRAGVKKSKNLLPSEVQAMQEAQKNGQAPPGEPTVETDTPSMAYGLSFAQQSTEKVDSGAAVDQDQAMPDVKPVETKPLTDDEIAMQALIWETTGDNERRSDLVIESATKEEEPVRYSELGSFRTDVASRPEPATLDAYNAIPVEEFGAALLRGMGWKDGQSIGRGNYSSATAAEKAKNPRVPERRPGFLGIGAKDSSGGKGAETELGAWGKAAMRKASRKQGDEDDKAEGVYMPITMRNKKTGEQLTEEELAALQKEAKSRPPKEDDWRERRDRNLEKSGRDKDRDREYRKRDYDDEEDRSRRKTGSSRRDRDRSRSSGRQSSSRSSRYDDDDKSRRDDRSYRDRDHDRDRRRDRDDDKDDRRRDGDRERDRDRSHRSRDDRYSSSRHSSHSSRNDRDRDRDRDSRRSRRDD
ncbi:Pre-mRNA-splicing factor spp2, Aspergillus-type [Penicillium italicum]|uniref:Pre-mRNA-splicing factor n=1 Tax=Penicillium italicum TaxID=40296 RepID=A0A0A2L7J8_PENIT|nr:Pre-mRNA-splicing factor spp2, Aspergillus-type [Penicillium italicum]